MAERKKKLSAKQIRAIELLTCGAGLSYKEIAQEVNVNPKTLWEWRNQPEFVIFQEEIKRINDERWLATVDAAREAAKKLVEKGNQRMVEFVLKNEGYNPTQKLEADLHTDIQINIEE